MYNAKFGENLKRWRMNQGLSQYEVAANSRVSQNTVHMMERGYFPKKKNLLKVMEALGATTRSLFYGTGLTLTSVYADREVALFGERKRKESGFTRQKYVIMNETIDILEELKLSQLKAVYNFASSFVNPDDEPRWKSTTTREY